MSKARELANLRGTPTDHNILLQSTAGDALTAGGGTHNIAAGLNALGAATTGGPALVSHPAEGDQA